MNRYIITLVVSSILVLCYSCQQQNISNTSKLTGINPLAYTSVVYSSEADTVFIATYSGRIAQRIKNIPDEKIIANIDDEIYALEYSKRDKTIFAATLNSGILVINPKTGKILKKLSIDNSWTISLSLTPDENLLFTSDVSGKNYLWDIGRNFEEIILPEKLLKKRIQAVNSFNQLYFVAGNMVTVWDKEKRAVEDEYSIGYNKIADIDEDGNIILLNHNEALFFDKKQDSIIYKVNHPNWIYFDSNDQLLGEIPLSLKLTEARLSQKKIYTASIDRSVRVWDKQSGELLDSWTGHKATISDMQLNIKGTQIVTVDLKGIIKFWDLTF